MSTTPIPINYAGPLEQAQSNQSADTQAGVMHTGADLLNNMTTQRLDKLYKTQDAVNNAIGETIKAASTPVPVSGTGAINPPNTNHQWPIIPNDNRPTYSHSGSVKEGIANTIRGVANVVGAYETKHKNDQNKALSIDIQRIMEAHQGIESAKQALQQNPQDEDAKKVLQKNTDIINALLNDPKKRKQIGKAFDISFVDPSQNNKPEHAALQTAIKSYSEQLQEKLPAQMGANQVAQQKLGQLTELQKNISDQIRAVNSDKTAEAALKYYEHLDNLQQKQADLKAKQEHWHDVIDQQNERLLATLQARQKAVETLVNGRKDVAGMQANAAMMRANKLINARFQYLKEHDADPLTQIRILTPALNATNVMSKNLADDILKQEALRDAKGVQDKEPYNQRIHADEEALKQYKDMADQINDQITVIREAYVKGPSDGSNTESSDNTDSSIEQPIAPPRPSLQNKPSESGATPKTQPTSQPVQPVGGTEDKSDEIIKQLSGLIKNS